MFTILLPPFANPIAVNKYLLICDKSVTTQNFGIFESLVSKETFADALLTGIMP